MPTTYSPFRYPGGKSQLFPFVQNLLQVNNTHGTYIEPFAGGSATGLKLLFRGQVEHIVINDYDTSIYAVWNAIINHPDYLVSNIKSVPFDYYTPGNDTLNIEFWKRQHTIYFEEANNPQSLAGAFATLFLNRTNRSGIITGGPLGGWSQQQTKISERFNKATLIEKVLSIHSRRSQITISNVDALKLIPMLPAHYNAEDTFIFFDPPYVEQGSNLYFSSLNKDDHKVLAKEILSLPQFKWIVTYDHQPLINHLYASASGRYEYWLNYSANGKNRGKAPEYLFSSPVTKLDSYEKTQLNAL